MCARDAMASNPIGAVRPAPAQPALISPRRAALPRHAIRNVRETLAERARSAPPKANASIRSVTARLLEVRADASGLWNLHALQKACVLQEHYAPRLVVRPRIAPEKSRAGTALSRESKWGAKTIAPMYHAENTCGTRRPRAARPHATPLMTATTPPASRMERSAIAFPRASAPQTSVRCVTRETGWDYV